RHQPTTPPSPTIDSNKKGFHGYEEKESWFNLALPPECIADATKIISCQTKNFTLTINPEAGADDTPSTEIKDITFNNITWTRFTFDHHPRYSASYQLNKNTT